MAIRELHPDDPATLGPYRLTGRLGAGGMGVVYLGFGDDGHAVAVKTLRAGADADSRIRMRREAEHMSALSSPRVARLVGCDTDAPIPWIALTYVAGPSLAEAPVPLAGPSLQALAVGLAEAVTALRAAGVVHRDIKPGNVILSFDGPVLVDLGIARSDAATAMTQVGTTIGSPGWMAPEQLRGEPVSSAVDVWGWGAVVAFAATGRLPFGDGELAALAYRIQVAEPDLTGVPAGLERLIRAALAKDPSHRPAPDQLLAADSGVLASVAPVAPVLPASAPPESGTARAMPDARMSPGTIPRSSVPTALWVVAAAVVAALVAAVGVSVAGSQSARTADEATAAADRQLTAGEPSLSTTSPSVSSSATSSPSPSVPATARTAVTASAGPTVAPAQPRPAPPKPAPAPPPAGGGAADAQARLISDLRRIVAAETGRQMFVRCPGAVVASGRYLQCYASSSEAELDNVALDVIILNAPARRYTTMMGESAAGTFKPNMSCRNFSMAALPYFYALAYYFDQGRPARLDADGNGRPCETTYPPDQVAAEWRGQ